MGLRIDLWTWQYEPEPTGIGPVAASWARSMSDRGYDVRVVTAHPHYPTPQWGRSWTPYHEQRDGIPVLRLPLWIGRQSALARMREEASYALSASVAVIGRRRPDVAVVVSPSLMSLAPSIMQASLRGVPWVLWLQDIVTSAAATTGLVRSRAVLGSARGLERLAYRSAARVVVISDAHRRMLIEEGVPAEKLVRIYNPATRPVIAPEALGAAEAERDLRVLCMGNIGFSQNLPRLVQAFEQSERLPAGTCLIITGTGELEPEVRAEVRSERVEMKGLLPTIDDELDRAAVGLVPQRPDIVEFNLPSKLMNFMARGVPVLASVRPDSETARLVQRSGGGWLADASDPDAFPETVLRIAGDPEDRAARGRKACSFAAENFSAEVVADQFERILEQTVARSNRVAGGSGHE